MPNGCRRFGIQTKDKPSKIVGMSGLGECQGFEPKKKPESDKKGIDLNRKDLW